MYSEEKFNKAKNAYIAGALDTWAIMIQENPEMNYIVIREMKEMALLLKKSAGVIIFDDDKKQEDYWCLFCGKEGPRFKTTDEVFAHMESTVHRTPNGGLAFFKPDS